MVLYLFLVLFLLIGSFLKQDKKIFILSFLIMLLIGGLRGISVGTDTINYKDLYSGVELKGFEVGYYYLNDYIISHGYNFQIMIFISMLLCLFPVFFVSSKLSSRPLLSVTLYVLLYFYFNSFNVMRQSIAISLFFLALYFYHKNNKSGYIISIIVAALFHTTALIVLVIYPFYKIHIHKFIYIILILVSFFVGALNIFPLILQKFDIGELYKVYLEVSLGSATSFSFTRLLLNMWLLYLIISGNHNDLFLKNFFIGVFLLNIFSFSPVLARISQYFLLAQIIVIPNLMLSHSYKYQRNFQVIGVLYAIIVFAFLISSNVGEVVPYTFCI